MTPGVKVSLYVSRELCADVWIWLIYVDLMCFNVNVWWSPYDLYGVSNSFSAPRPSLQRRMFASSKRCADFACSTSRGTMVTGPRLPPRLPPGCHRKPLPMAFRCATDVFPVKAPHAWLFPRCSCVVHHGGLGTTEATLRAGIPSASCRIPWTWTGMIF